MALGRSLGGGMGLGLVCGAVSGAMLVLGLAQGPCPQGERRSRQEALLRAGELREEFSRRRGSVLCRDILGVDPSSEEGHRQAVLGNLFRDVCPLVVDDCARILEAMLDRPAPAAQDPRGQ